MSKKKVKVEWVTYFTTNEEVESFIKEISDIHARRYATNVVENSLLDEGYYNGANNNIKVVVD